MQSVTRGLDAWKGSVIFYRTSVAGQSTRKVHFIAHNTQRSVS